MSKVIKTKPEIHEMNQPLRGMPALKQIRSSKRQEALWPKLSPTNGQILVGKLSTVFRRCFVSLIFHWHGLSSQVYRCYV